MKASFLKCVVIPLCFALIIFSNSCKQSTPSNSQNSEWVTYNTEFDSSRHIISVVDYDNSFVSIHLDDKKGYTHYTYSIGNDTFVKEFNEQIALTNKIDIDLKSTLNGSKFEEQDLELEVNLIRDTITRTIKRDIKYQFDLSSPIPFVNIITEGGRSPEDSTRIPAEFEFYDIPSADGQYKLTGPHQSATGTIHARGQGSLSFPKKSFALNFGKENPMSIMEMPSSHKWVMIGNWIDISHLCNKVSYDLYADMGHYGPQSRHVQVYLNHEYWGLYTFGEKVQRGKNHVDTRKKSKGGFIVKEVDKENPDFETRSGRRFEYEYPDDEAPESMKMDIRNKIDLYEEKVENNKDWQNYVNEEAEIDYFIITDVFANPDSYYNGKNVFYFYNRDNKLEPVIWDFIWSFGTPYYVCDNNNPWCYIYSPVGAEYCNPDTPCSSWIRVPYNPNQELMYGNPKYEDRLGFNRFLLMENYMKSAQNVNMFKERYRDWRKGENGKEALLSDKAILSEVDRLMDVLKSGGIYKKDSLRWQEEDRKFHFGMRFTPDQVREKIKERLAFMDVAVDSLQVTK